MRQPAAARHLGHQPEQGSRSPARVPVPGEIADDNKRRAAETSLAYMGPKGGEKITDIAGSIACSSAPATNGRLEDLRAAPRGRRQDR